MSSDFAQSSDAAGVNVAHLVAAHERRGLFGGALDPRTKLYLPPMEHFGHSLEELIDLAKTRFHGGEPVVSPETLVAATQPARNAIRVVVRNKKGELKQLILDHNCRTNSGGTWLNILMGGDVNANIAYINTSGANTFTATGVTPTASPTWTTNQWVGHLVVAPTTVGATPSFVVGTVLSNSATALVVDQWTNPTSTTGAVGSTPPANASFFIMNGQGPAYWMGLSTDATTEDIGNTTLASETTTGFTVAGRWKGIYSQTTAPVGSGTTNSNAIYKIDPGILTANGTQTITKLGLFNAFVNGILIFVKKLTTAASVISGDTLDPSWSITDS